MKAAKILAGLLLATLITAGVMNVQSVDRVETVVEKSVVVARGKTEDQLGTNDQRADKHSSPSDSTVAPDQDGPGRPAPEEAKTADTPKETVTDKCACGKDCQCADPMICRIGDCQKSYAIVFSGVHCGPCKTMVPMIVKLRSEGYHVYYWYTTDYPEAAKKFNIAAVPTTYFFDEGKEQGRFVGVVGEATFRRFLKPHVVPVGDGKPSYNLVGE